MKLRKVQVHNFRGILDQSFDAMDYTLLVGPNNSGKSTLIDAIRAFYEKEGFKFKPGEDFPHIGTQDDESWVELTFALTDEEEESLADNYRDGSHELRVRKYFKSSEKKGDGKPKAGFIFAYEVSGDLAEDAFYGAKNVQSGKLGDLVYIPAISKVDEHAKLSGPSALRDLLTGIMADVVEGGEAFPEFVKRLEAFAETVRTEETEDERSLFGFEAQLNGMIASWDTEFRLTFPPPSAASIIKNLLDWEIKDSYHGKPQSVEHYGSGFQRHLIYCLIQLGAQYIGQKAKKKKKDFTPDLSLVLFEEPEAFLHPPQQVDLARNLREVASRPTWQVICSTHSSHFASRQASDIPSIARLRREAGEMKASQISEQEWSDIVDANAAINLIAEKYPKLAKRFHEDDKKPDMEAVKHFLWLNPDRTSAFFANHVLSHAVLHDDDHQREWNAEINQLIDDSRNAFTMAIQALKGELEDVLGIPRAGAPHRKPQHVLYQYEIGTIAGENLTAFCEALSLCLGVPAGDEITAADEEGEK